MTTTDLNIAGLVERSKVTEAIKRQFAIVYGQTWDDDSEFLQMLERNVLEAVLSEPIADSALTALQQERDQIEAKTWEEAAKVADAEAKRLRNGGAINACRAIAQALRSRASAARTNEKLK